MSREVLRGDAIKQDTPAGGYRYNLQPDPVAVIARESGTIARFALQSLHQELAAFPKPGLVSPVDNGSHRDMDAALFFRSLFSLRHYFSEIAAAGMRKAEFAELKQLGIAAEERMMQATSGINTHRGAIFNLGLLAAAAGSLKAENRRLKADEIAERIRSFWGDAIRAHGAKLPKTSHGGLVACRYRVGGALHEAACGFPHVFEVGLPILLECHARGVDQNSTAVQCLFFLMSKLTDTNLLYRGGDAGLRFVQRVSSDFIADGGVFQPDWKDRAVDLHTQFIAKNLSPGGSADMLAATLFAGRLLHSHGTCRADLKDGSL
jgi:triphosphoribosyl-dephospho-CoA synthase